MEFDDNRADNYCTLEHLWPSSYGGDSISENLLPACAPLQPRPQIELRHLGHDERSVGAAWARPGHGAPNFITGPSQFALHHWAGQRYAINNKTNLRTALEDRPVGRDLVG